MWDFPSGSPGQPIKELWEAAKRAVRSARLLQGAGILLTRTADGTIISTNATAPIWASAFLVTLNQDRATILPGLVNGQMPLLNNVYLDGTVSGSKSKTAAPTLDMWGTPAVDNEGRGTGWRQ